MVLRVISDELWAVLEPLRNEARPWAARPIQDLRRTIEAIVWRHGNGAKWRSIPAELGPLGSRQAAPVLRNG
jgi:transposase